MSLFRQNSVFMYLTSLCISRLHFLIFSLNSDSNVILTVESNLWSSNSRTIVVVRYSCLNVSMSLRKSSKDTYVYIMKKMYFYVYYSYNCFSQIKKILQKTNIWLKWRIIRIAVLLEKPEIWFSIFYFLFQNIFFASKTTCRPRSPEQ